ncbi:MAG: carboxypeptidase regulatory-like domain-containing protein [Phycisphaeraceae bacterium]|nr:carboxypeptidase regulatory-like domain-containing protein [Phycisphaeraceae bacterium]
MKSKSSPKTPHWMMQTVCIHFFLVLVMTWMTIWASDATAQEASTQLGTRLTLQGRVTDASGGALKDAHVFIYTAKPKLGPAYLCPSCYPDCGKEVTTDADGRFVIHALASSLRFRILVVREGYLSQFMADIDPANGPVTVAMETLDLSAVSTERLLQGRVVNDRGEPVVGASVTVKGWSSNRGSRTFGSSSQVLMTPVAVSNLQGEFSLVARQDVLGVELQIHCRNHAQAEFYEIPFGQSRRDFQLAEGSTITGRLIHKGNSMAGRTILASSKNRGGSNFTRESIATGPEGRFTFRNLPSELVYHVTASMESIGELGITPLTRVADLKNGQSHDVGDLVIQPGLTVSGRVELSDGRPMPTDSMIFLNHEKIWGGLSQTLGPDGTFTFAGMHPGKVGCPIRIPGYRIAKLNRSYYDLNGGRLEGILTDSVTNLVFLMEPGDRDWNGIGYPKGIPWTETPRFRPFSGFEPLAEDRLAARVCIQAVDAETGVTLDTYQVSPGWKFDSDQDPGWQLFQARTVHSADVFIDVEKRSGPAFIQVAAEGFLPASIQVEGNIGGTVTVQMQPGQGVRGVVLRPDGAPASKAQVVMLSAPAKGKSSNYGFVSLSNGRFGRETSRQHALLETDPTGKFSFPPGHETHPLFFAHETGFAVEERPETKESLKVHLQPWAHISGSISNFDAKDDWLIQVSARRPRLSDDPAAKSIGGFGFLSTLVRSFKKNTEIPEQSPRLPTIGNIVTPTETGEFNVDHIPPGHWWVVLAQMKLLPGEASRGLSTLKPFSSIEIDAESGAVSRVTLTVTGGTGTSN